MELTKDVLPAPRLPKIRGSDWKVSEIENDVHQQIADLLTVMPADFLLCKLPFWQSLQRSQHPTTIANMIIKSIPLSPQVR
jgi:hypothetical protein